MADDTTTTDESDELRATTVGRNEATGEELVVFNAPDANVEQMLQAQIAATPQAGNSYTRSTRGSGEVGPMQRTTSGHTIWGQLDPKQFVLNSTELATTMKRFRDEMYRNQFPVILPAFQQRCTACRVEFDEDVDECVACGAGPEALEGPDKAQKHTLKQLFTAVNADKQSLYQVMKQQEDVQTFRGVSTILARLRYQRVERETQVAGRGFSSETVYEPTEIKELVPADPTRILPVTDEQNRHGGWWTCPKHRGQYWEAADLSFDGEADHPTEVCPDCEARLEEVGYVETGSNRDDIESLFLKDEVIDWARHFPEMNGLDGRPPILPLIKLQAILQWHRNYELQYLNPQNDQQLPDKFLVAYGKNVRASLRASLKAEEQKNPWEEGRLFYEGSPEDVEIDLLDLSRSSGINGRESMVDRLMSQIRAMFGVTDAFENELSDTGGLNAEGTQVEITNSAIAAAHQDTKDQALDALTSLIERVHGYCDWELAFVDPETDDQQLDGRELLEAVALAQETGTEVSIKDGQLQIPDQTIDVGVPESPPEDAAPPDEAPANEDPPEDEPPVEDAPAETAPDDQP